MDSENKNDQTAITNETKNDKIHERMHEQSVCESNVHPRHPSIGQDSDQCTVLKQEQIVFYAD